MSSCTEQTSEFMTSAPFSLRANIAGTLSVVAIREQGEKETQHVR